MGLNLFDFLLSSSTHFWTTSTDEVAWPQGDQILGGGLVPQGQDRTSEPGKHKKKVDVRGENNDKRRKHLKLVDNLLCVSSSMEPLTGPA